MLTLAKLAAQHVNKHIQTHPLETALNRELLKQSGNY